MITWYSTKTPTWPDLLNDGSTARIDCIAETSDSTSYMVHERMRAFSTMIRMNGSRITASGWSPFDIARQFDEIDIAGGKCQPEPPRGLVSA
jgi:hypothetical protein